VLGERRPDETSPFGARGNSIVRHLGESYDNVVLTAGFSKAYSSLLAFIACPPEIKRLLKVLAAPYMFSGPSPVASLATVLLGLEVNEAKGDSLRGTVWRHTDRLLRHVDKLGVVTLNTSGFPVVELQVADPTAVGAIGELMFERGIYVTLAPFPIVPRDQAGFRIQLTAANTDEQVAHLLAILDEVNEVFGLRPRYA
jgi:8-amino-7-oxononanoate synthase